MLRTKFSQNKNLLKSVEVVGVFDIVMDCIKDVNTLLCTHMKGEGLHHINQFNPATLLCLAQVSIQISIKICHGIHFVFSDLRWWRGGGSCSLYYIGGIVDNHCLILSFHKPWKQL